MKRWTNGLPGATKRLGAKMALRGLAASQPRMRPDIHDGPEQIAPLQRPDTLMQLSRSLISEVHLVRTAGPYILAQSRHAATLCYLSAFGGLCCKTILPVRAPRCVVAKSPPQHRTRVGKPRKVTRKKPAKNAMPSASERPFQSFLSLRASEIHWPSGWSLRTSPDQIVWLQISRESVHRLFQARRLLAQSSQCQVLRPLAPRR